MYNLLTNRTFGLVAGLSFTALVLGLIVYGNFFASSSHPTLFTWEARPTLYVCDSAPDWAKPDAESFVKATEFWEEQGWAFENIEVGPCAETCTVSKEKAGETMEVTCNKGKVTLDLMDQWWSEDHAGVCRFPSGVEVMQDRHWTTILLPNVILGTDEFGEFGSETPMLPPDAEAIVLAHEIGHCLAGLGHNQGPPVVPGCARLNPKTGAVMNPSVYGGGWVDEAVPPSPAAWD